MKKIMVLGSLNMDFVISVKDVYKRQALVESRKREQYLNKIIPELNLSLIHICYRRRNSDTACEV